jgi:hypothetical protein
MESTLIPLCEQKQIVANGNKEAELTDTNANETKQNVEQSLQLANLRAIPLYGKHDVIVDYTWVDTEHYDMLSTYKWHKTQGGYAATTVSQKGLGLNSKQIRMHRMLLKAPPGFVVDHRDRNPLCNSILNLRLCTHSQNAQNRSKSKHAKSRYFGVTTCGKGSSKWKAVYRHKNLGQFVREDHAAWCYDQYVDQIGDLFAPRNNIAKPNDFVPPKKICHSLPKNIHISGKRYKVQKVIDGVLFQETFATLNEAQKKLQSLEDEKRLKDELQMVAKSTVISRTEEGVAYFECSGKQVLVDDETYHKYIHLPCHLNASGYPSLTIGGQPRTLHSLVLGRHGDAYIDHVYRNKLDARLNSLRFASASENSHNRTLPSNRMYDVPYSNVNYNVSQKKYEVRVNKDFVNFSGGSYSDMHVAGWAANQLAKDVYGPDFGKLNKIELPDYIWYNQRALPSNELPAYIEKEKELRYKYVRRTKWGTYEVIVQNKIKKKFRGGTYKNIQEAAMAANYLAKEILGDRAELNNVVLPGYSWINRKLISSCQKMSYSDTKVKETSETFPKYHYVYKGKNLRKQFTVQIYADKKTHNGGAYYNILEAALAANHLALELHGENAKLNDVTLSGYIWQNHRLIPDPSVPLPYHNVKKVLRLGTYKAFVVDKDGQTHDGCGDYKTMIEAAMAADFLSKEMYGDSATQLNNVNLPGYVWHKKRLLKQPEKRPRNESCSRLDERLKRVKRIDTSVGNLLEQTISTPNLTTTNA